MLKLLNSANSYPVTSSNRGERSIADLFFSNVDYAIVSQPVSSNNRGRIHYQGTYWFAYSLGNDLIPVGTPVDLVQLKGNTWLVTPIVCQGENRSF